MHKVEQTIRELVGAGDADQAVDEKGAVPNVPAEREAGLQPMSRGGVVALRQLHPDFEHHHRHVAAHRLHVGEQDVDYAPLVESVVPIRPLPPRPQFKLPEEILPVIQELLGLGKRKFIKGHVVPLARGLGPSAPSGVVLLEIKTHVDRYGVALLEVRRQGKETIFKSGPRFRLWRQSERAVDQPFVFGRRLRVFRRRRLVDREHSESKNHEERRGGPSAQPVHWQSPYRKEWGNKKSTNHRSSTSGGEPAFHMSGSGDDGPSDISFLTASQESGLPAMAR